MHQRFGGLLQVRQKPAAMGSSRGLPLEVTLVTLLALAVGHTTKEERMHFGLLPQEIL